MTISKFLNNRHYIIIEITYYIVIIYVVSMYVYPFFSGRGWGYVQLVWDRWQSLNAGVLAFVAAVVGFSISKYRVEQDRLNELSVARVGLPNALSEVSAYTVAAKEFVDSAFRKSQDYEYVFNADAPRMSVETINSIAYAIKYSVGDVKNRLSEIIELQQILMARLDGLAEFAKGRSRTVYIEQQKYGFYYLIAEVRYSSDSLFSFARRKIDDVDESIKIENAFSVLGLDLIPGFEEFAEKNKGRRTLN